MRGVKKGLEVSCMETQVGLYSQILEFFGKLKGELTDFETEVQLTSEDIICLICCFLPTKELFAFPESPRG